MSWEIRTALTQAVITRQSEDVGSTQEVACSVSGRKILVSSISKKDNQEGVRGLNGFWVAVKLKEPGEGRQSSCLSRAY